MNSRSFEMSRIYSKKMFFQYVEGPDFVLEGLNLKGPNPDLICNPFKIAVLRVLKSWCKMYDIFCKKGKGHQNRAPSLLEPRVFF